MPRTALVLVNHTSALPSPVGTSYRLSDLLNRATHVVKGRSVPRPIETGEAWNYGHSVLAF